MLPGSWGFSAISSDPRSSQQPPIALPVVSSGSLTAQYHLGIRTAIRQLGGYPVLLFLYGHAVDRGPDDCQSIALEILFQWLRYDATESHLFEEKRCFWMLQHAFETEKARPESYAPVLLNLACSSGVDVDDAIVCDSSLLSFTLKCWRNWNGALDLVLKALQNLMRDDHPHRDFNVFQMERARVLETLLQMAQVFHF